MLFSVFCVNSSTAVILFQWLDIIYSVKQRENWENTWNYYYQAYFYFTNKDYKDFETTPIEFRISLRYSPFISFSRLFQRSLQSKQRPETNQYTRWTG